MLLGRLLEAAGRMDFADESALRGFHQQCMAVVEMLRTHARVEVLFIDAFLVDPSGANDLRCEHVELEAEMFALIRTLEGLDDNGVAETRARGHSFYLALSRFVARYLFHMADEETRALPLLHRRVDDATLREVLAAAQSAIQEGEGAKSRSAIADAVGPHERELLRPPKAARKSTAA